MDARNLAQLLLVPSGQLFFARLIRDQSITTMRKSTAVVQRVSWGQFIRDTMVKAQPWNDEVRFLATQGTSARVIFGSGGGRGPPLSNAVQTEGMRAVIQQTEAMTS